MTTPHPPANQPFEDHDVERAAYEWLLCLITAHRANLDLAIRRGLGLPDTATTGDVHRAVHQTDRRSATAQAAAYYRAYQDMRAASAGADRVRARHRITSARSATPRQVSCHPTTANAERGPLDGGQST